MEFMATSRQPLAEVFGHLTTDHTGTANRYRSHRLCRFNNKVPNCTKDKAADPLGVCSIYHENHPVITCPIRFREDWIITDDAADFFFDEGTTWSSLTEVRLNESDGKSAGNIDVVLVAYDERGKVYDFGALEVQAVYISGNVCDPFAYYMEQPSERGAMDWSTRPNYPRPDYLSSSRKRLAPQLVFKGGILHNWEKKIAVAMDKNFFATLPSLKRVPKAQADIAWFIYDLELGTDKGTEPRKYSLKKVDEVFTEFEVALRSITTPSPGRVEDFIRLLQGKLDKERKTPPVNKTIKRPF
jgi:Restriction endonuclease NotI